MIFFWFYLIIFNFKINLRNPSSYSLAPINRKGILSVKKTYLYILFKETMRVHYVQ